ncbi:MAG: NAD(P)-binding domain-containing protein [Planctomycetaceae bacterium]|nr:NAD(P)-binding domain-containing protein [Planctomycetaceae bacterium]
MSAVTIIGFGRLGSAIARGVLRSGTLQAADMVAVDADPARMAEAKAAGLRTMPIEQALAEACRVLVAVKPRELGATHVIRAMPTVAATVGASTTALSMGAEVPATEADFARTLFGSIGPVIEIDEAHLDAATACGASGVAYACLFIEAMEAAATRMGVPAEAARAFAVSAAEGAAAAWRHGQVPPAELRASVTSPAGTTAAALAVLQQGGFESLLERAAIAARDRARELGVR